MKKKQLFIVIVDDNSSFVERMIGLLSEGVDVKEIKVAGDYDEAKRILDEGETPDLVLLDINLPGRSGIEVLKMIKNTERKCRVIMISNYADDYYREQCRQLGADHFLDKSNDFSIVPDIISTLHFN